MSKPLTLARLNDLTLGAFANVAPSETLDHLIRYLSTWSGSEYKPFQIIQYSAKLLVPFLQLRARLQHRAGLRSEPVSNVAPSLKKLADVVSGARELWGIWGLLPIVQWLISLERSPPPTRRLHTIERLQGWSMLAFYPLQHIYYLRSRDIIPTSASLPLPVEFASTASVPKGSAKSSVNVPINATALSLWSTRLWAVYVVLQLAHLGEDRELLRRRQRALSREKAAGEEQREEIKQRWAAWYNELAVNLAYLPMTIHWSLERGLFKNEVWVSALGLAAAVASFRSGWTATALRPPSDASPAADSESIEGLEKAVPGLEI
ncbi:hypothetical protein FA95DRAFT_1497534 [Auriscalpium vulgare]|uniref:Uncharacterized protein n=1 Tax=Auriscalpium vulgare TaxID=40419 RepID=A0ACB8RJ21_9AGAM|nr:hypothetical protein FA95DRAFT_1497534 [Auriscalpium vulgare]